MLDATARNFTFLAYGLSVVWVILVIYVLTLASREKRISGQIKTLERMLEDKERK